MKKPTDLYISSKDWNKKKGEVVGTSKEILRIQGILSKKKADFNKYFLNFDATGGKISRKVIDDYFDDHRFDNFKRIGVVEERFVLSHLIGKRYIFRSKESCALEIWLVLFLEVPFIRQPIRFT